MPSLKNPLLSLHARGTLAGTLTYQRAAAPHIARSKPTLPYFLTLPAQYQRWLFQDYAHLWTLQSDATKATYRAASSRYHLTPFQYWMRYQLTNLPDIAAMWHLDDLAGPTAHDSSRNGNHGTIIGASPITGPIDRARHFDGINDLITFPVTPSLSNMTARTVEYFWRAPTMTPQGRYIWDGNFAFAPYGDIIWLYNLQDRIITTVRNTLGVWATVWWLFTPDIWYHYAYTWDGTNLRGYHNGAQQGAAQPLTGTVACTFRTCTMSTLVGGRRYLGDLDHFTIYNRALDPTEILRHSLRTWPHA